MDHLFNQSCTKFLKKIQILFGSTVFGSHRSSKIHTTSELWICPISKVSIKEEVQRTRDLTEKVIQELNRGEPLTD